MPNVKGFTPLADPSWISLEFDDGTVSNPVQDPTGEYRAEVQNIVAKFAAAQPPTTEQQYGNAVSKLAMGPGASQVAGRGLLEKPNPMAGALAGPAMRVIDGPVSGSLPAVGGAAQGASRVIGSDVATPGQVFAPPPPAAAPGPETGAFPAPSAAPRGMVRSGVGRTLTGMAGEDKANVDRLNTEAVEATGEANAATVKARLDQLTNDWARISDREKAELAKQQLLEDREKQFTERFEAQMAANKETAARPVDPAQAFEGDAGWYAFMAAFGDAVSNFGAAISGRGPVADPAGRINAIIDRSVRLQTAQKQADFEAGKITADQLEAERERVRLNLATVGDQLVKTQEAKALTENERLGLDALGKSFRAQQADAMAKNATATARQETRQEQFSPVVTGPAKVTNATKEALALLGVTPEQYTEGMNKKLGASDNAPTVNQAITSINEMDQDTMMFKAIMAANDNTIPTRGAINIPESIRGKMAQLGVKSGMDAEEASQIMKGYIIKKAKSYGGAVTDADRESAELEFGKSGQGFLRGLQRMRGSTNGILKQSIDTIFPGVGQDVLGISLRRTAQTPGVEAPSDAIEDFEKQSAPHRSPDAQTPRVASGRSVESMLGFDNSDRSDAAKKARIEAEAEAEFQKRRRERTGR